MLEESDVRYLKGLESKIVVLPGYDTQECIDRFHSITDYIISDGIIHILALKLMKVCGIYAEMYSFVFLHNIEVIKDKKHWMVQLLTLEP